MKLNHSNSHGHLFSTKRTKIYLSEKINELDNLNLRGKIKHALFEDVKGGLKCITK